MVNNVVSILRKIAFAPIITLLIAFGLANAQPEATKSGSEVTQSSAKLVGATQEYQARSAELVRMQESEVTKATAKLDELRQLVAEGLVAKVELEESEQLLSTLRGQLEMTRKEIADSEERIARIRAEQESAKAQVQAAAVKLAS